MIRMMTQADIAAVSRIAAVSMPQPWSREAFLRELRNPQTLLLVWVSSEMQDRGSREEILGYISLQMTPDDAELTGIAVDETARRQGIAGALLSTARGMLRDRGIEAVVLEVRASNVPAVAFYEKHGFTCIGVRKGFYDFPKEDALVMTVMKE